MPDQKISQLASGTNAQAGDLFVIARSGANYSLTTAQLFNAPSATATLAALTVDTNTLFVDAANNRVGINTLTPSARLDINTGASASAIVMQAASDTAAQMQLGVGANGGSAPALVSTGNGLQIATTSASAITLFTNSVERLRLDAAGHLGLNRVPSAWSGSWKAIQVNNVTSVFGGSDNGFFGVNVFNDGVNKYIGTGFATLYGQTASNGQHAWYVAPSGITGNAISFTQAMTLDANNRLLIDTTTGGVANSSFTKLTVGGSAATNYASVKSSGGEELLFGTTAGSTFFGAYSSHPLQLRTDNTERMRISSAGNVGIGTTSPAGKLQVTGTSASWIISSAGTELYNTFSGQVKIHASNAAGSLFLGAGGRDNDLRLDASGNFGIGVTPSAWGSSYRSIDLSTAGNLWARSSDVGIAFNAYNDGADWRYKTATLASLARQTAGRHEWYTAASGTAGATISFTEVMRLDTSGNLVAGATAVAGGVVGRLTVDGPIALVGSPGGAGAGNRYISGGGTANTWYHNVPSGGQYMFNIAEVTAWRITSAGHLITGADNTYDIGAAGATRPRDLHLSRNLHGGGWLRAGAASAGAASTTTIGSTTTTAVGATGAASALPANPLGYIIAHVGTTEVRIPYYNA